ncbi:MAG: BglII/BstYI family type II restriction endonuclease [Actinomycetota bacterium]
MRLVSAHHQHGKTICEHDFPAEASSLVNTLSLLEPPVYPVDGFDENSRPKKPKRQMRPLPNGGTKPFIMPVDQGAMNTEISKALRADGWTSEPVAAGPMASPGTPLGLKGDFVRNGVFVEVEFGNVASMHRDFFKFQIANRAGAGAVGVLVVATDKLARFFDSGVATFEIADKSRPFLAIGVQMPIWIIGIEPDDFEFAIGRRYREMWDLCRQQGVECHPWKIAIGP